VTLHETKAESPSLLFNPVGYKYSIGPLTCGVVARVPTLTEATRITFASSAAPHNYLDAESFRGTLVS
jgi:hypothetical protein